MMESGPTVPDLARIWLLLEHSRPALAEKAARQRLVADPADWAAYVGLAQALAQQDQLAEAAQAAREAIRLAPEAYQTHYVLGIVEGRSGRLLKADQAVLEALRLAPYHAQLYGFRAQVCYLLGQYTAAQHCAEQGLYFDAEQLECLLWRALTLEARNQPEAADADFARLLRLAPTNAPLHRHLGTMLLQRREPQAAARHLAEALRLSPERAAVLLPLLRQARRQATWPAWLRRAAHAEAQERALGLQPRLRTPLVHLSGWLFRLRARWLTRHDPLFRPSQVQIWRRRMWLLLLSLPLFMLGLCLGNYFGVIKIGDPFTLSQTASLAGVSLAIQLGVYWIKKQIDKAAN